MEHKLHPVEKEELMAYLDGELPATRAAEVADHLDRCAECKPLVSELRLVSEKLAGWQVERAPQRLVERLTAALQSLPLKGPEGVKEKISPDTPKPTAPQVPRWVLGLAGAVTLFLLLVAVSIPNLLRSRVAVRQSSQPAGYGVGGAGMVGILPTAPEGRAFPSGPIIIRTASLTLYANDFDKTRNEIERVIRSHRGYAGQVNVTAYTGSARSMRATFQVPASELDAALSDLKKLGRVTEEALTAEEVTRQYVDLQARLVNARATEQRLKDILSRQAGRMQDVLAVEREIARVREEIERMTAEQKNLEARIQYAALSVTLNEEYRAGLESTAPSALTRLRNAVVEGTHGLSESVMGLVIFILSYGPTLLFWFAVLFYPARFAWRRLRT